jgi:DNA-binding MarR family transcriptional regulator
MPITIKQTQHSYATFRVLDLIEKGYNATAISKVLGINKSNASRRLYVLEKDNLVCRGIKSNFLEWRLTESGKSMLQHMRNIVGDATPNIKDFPITFRWHHLIFKIPILKKSPEMNRLLELKKFQYGAKRGFMRGWTAKLHGETVFYSGSSFLIFPQPTRANSLLEAVKLALSKIEVIAGQLRAMFPQVEMQFRADLCRQHLAMIGSITNTIPEGFKYQSDTLIVDASTGVPEIETIDKVYSIEHMRRIIAFLDDLATGELGEPK